MTEVVLHTEDTLLLDILKWLQDDGSKELADKFERALEENGILAACGGE